MTIKIGTTEIPVPEFISGELSKKKNRKLFDAFLRNTLAAQGQRIRSVLKTEYEKDKNQRDMFERMLKGMGL
jgi:hypothetical protein